MKRTRKFLISTMAIVLCIAIVLPASASRYATLRPGTTGEMVVAMQSALKALGYAIGVDGKYGKQTTQTVKEFQRKNKLTDDGLAGNMTLMELFSQVPQYKPIQGSPAMTLPPSAPSSPVTQPESQPSAGSAYVYTSNRGSLNVRNSPRYGNTTIGQLPHGTQVNIVGISGLWTQISANGLQGYVVSTFLRIAQDNPSVTPAPSTPEQKPGPSVEIIGTATVITGNRGSLNLRDRASYSGRAVLQIPYQATVQVHARIGQWSQVSYQNRTGFVVDSFLRHQAGNKTQAPTNTPSPSPAPSQQPNLPNADGIAFVNTRNNRTLNFRSTPSEGRNILRQIPAGEALILIKRGTEWCEVIYNGQQGFVMTSFLRFSGETPAASETPQPTQTPDATEDPVVTDEPTPEEPESPVFPRTLRPGDRGEDVLELQTRLIALKYMVSKTSVYDSMTKEAVRHFQAQNSLTVDGLFGGNSAQMLLSGAARTADSPALSYNTLRVDQRDGSDKAISKMQQALKDLGYPLSVTGRYDMPTHQAVVGFQQRNGLPITGIANPHTQSIIYAGNAKGYATPITELGDSEGKGGGPSSSSVKLLHWFKDVKPRVAAGQRVQIYHPASGISFTIRFYSMGNHADSEPNSWRDTQLMNRAFGAPSWNINTVYVKLPDGQWTLASMHNRPHLSGAINANGFGGHLCIHFLRDTDEVMKNDPDYGASNQRAIRKAWLNMTGENID
ncbi:MAG: SH3 domain-containing protein [Clostridiales bacterium]|nr:SH3 domain-containing protein [Clostridiales bacterium]